MRFWILSILLISYGYVFSQGEPPRDTIPEDKSTIERLTYQQQPGLAMAASKIYFSEKPYSISGFGEFNYVPVQSNVNRGVGDLELYYSGLYRFATFFGYRITDKLIWNSEIQIEYLHDGTREAHQEIVIEAFIDYLFKDYLKTRIGFYPLTIGYVNNNDEPIMFYSVNRSEVERLIVPSTWIEFGAMIYGNISEQWSYALGLSQGLQSRNFLSGSWIRQGREIRFDVPQSLSVNPQLTYTGIPNLTLSASGYFGNAGQGEAIPMGERQQVVNPKINLGTAYAKYDYENFRFISVANFGKLSNTEQVYELTLNQTGEGQVMGEEVFGYLFELGSDILPYLRNHMHLPAKSNWLYDSEELKFSLFTRFERLNTHHGIAPSLIDLPRVENNLSIWTFGLNFNTRENIVFKLNYQHRKNHFAGDPHPFNTVIETGIGFIF